MSCISRRACADRYNFKLFKEEGGTIKEKNCIWTEYKCPNVVLDGKLMCAECHEKVPNYRFQAAGKFNHGIVNGPYLAKSKVYGSPYYLECIKDGWKIKPEDEKRAKEAQLKTNTNMPPRKPKVDDSGGSPINVSVSSPVGSSSSSTEKPKQPRKPRMAKKASEASLTSLPSVQVLPSPNLAHVAQAVEVVALPIVASEVIVVKVKKIRHEGKDYYFDANSGKAYEAKSNGVGQYVGRYNPDAALMDTEYADSDEE